MKRKRGLPQYPGSKKIHISLIALIFIEAMMIVAQAIFLARAITFLFERTELSDVLIDIVLFFLAYIIRHLIQYAETSLTKKYAKQTGIQLRNELISSYFKHGVYFIQKEGTGHLVTLAVEGINDFIKYMEIIAMRTFKTVIIPIMIVIYVFTHDPISSVILVVTVPIIIIFMILLGLAAQQMADKQYETYQILSNHFIDSLKGLETLVYLGQSKKHRKRIHRVNDDYRKATNKTLRFAFSSSFALDFFTSLSIAFVAVGLGFRLIDGTITLLPALTILILAPEYFSPIKQVGKDYHATLDGQIAMEQIENVVQATKEQSNEENHINKWTASDQLRFSNVSLLAEQSKVSILKNMSFSVNGIGKIGIVGASGSGKSTLLNILTGRLQPTSGEISINGENVRLDAENWYEKIAYIPQQPYIFPLTLADNIRFYMPHASDEKVNEVIEQIGLSQFVAELPNGINEKIGEGGRTLSGGQEQRIAMARALLSDKPIILLDEPTAHLDIETEYEIKQVTQTLFKDKLVFLATHRLHWTSQMDHLIVLEQGEIVAQGHHDNLLQDSLPYKQMIMRRTGDEPDE